MARKIIIDTDPGVDDAMAILYALSDPALDLVALTTIFGNVPVERATQNALALCELAGREVPVSEGAALPLVQEPHPYALNVHGDEGFGHARLPRPKARATGIDAAEWIIDAVKEAPGEIALIPVGPLTNLANALKRAPDIVHLVPEVIVMGGAVRVTGNVNEHAEANIWQDPHAAEIVLAADWPVRLVGLDVTEQVVCTPADFDRIAAAKPVIGGFLKQATDFYIDFHRESEGLDGCHMHDPSAVIAAAHPEFLPTEELAIEVTTEGEAAGATRAIDKPHAKTTHVCTGVKIEAIRQRFLDVIMNGPLQ